jgi:hypothetical protein
MVALVAVVLIGMTGLILGLAVFANWSDGAIVGMVSGFGTIATGLIVAIRNQQKTAESIDQLQRAVGAGQRSTADTLHTVVQQTNGMSEAERQDIAERAAASVVKQFRGKVPS